MKEVKAGLNVACTSVNLDDVNSRLGNWGRWSRRSPGTTQRGPRHFNPLPPNDDDARAIEGAVSRIREPRFVLILRAWHQALAHKSEISQRMGIPLRKVGAEYRAARAALGLELARGDKPPEGGQKSPSPHAGHRPLNLILTSGKLGGGYSKAPHFHVSTWKSR